MSVTAGSFWNNLGQLYGMIGAEQRRDLWIVAALTVAGAFAEVAAIGSVVPFLALLAGGSSGAASGFTEKLFDMLGASSAGDQLVWATGVLSTAAIAAAVLRVVLVRRTQYFANIVGHHLSLEVQRRMLLQPYIWHSGQNSSRQLAIIEKVQLVSTLVLLPLVRACAAAFLIGSVAVTLLLIAPVATLVAGFVLAIAYFVIGAAARNQLYRNSEVVDSALGARTKIVQEATGGIREIILEGSQETALAKFRTIDLKIARALANNSVLSTIPRYLVEAAGIIVIAGLALFLSRRAGGLVDAIPLLGALALGAQRMLPLVQQLFQGWSSVAAHRAMIGEVGMLLQMPLPPPAADAPPLPFERSVDFADVSFRFPGRKAEAVSGLTFSIGKGMRIALAGRTGSGKSTTADLLMGLLVPERGEIRIDGVPLDRDNLQSWRGNIAHVPQTPFLADASIAENIAFSGNLDMRRVRECAALAQLSSFIEALPGAYDTHVGERGARLSGGQRQRLAIARAIYKGSPVLVLDEATSALDDQTEAAFATTLDALQAQGTTIVIIAHRSSITEGCDKIIRLENGRIAEKGDV